MKTFTSCLIATAVFLLSGGANHLFAVPDELKEKGVLYFDDNLPQKLEVPLAEAVYLHSDRFFTSPQVAFAKGKKVRVVGVAPEGFLIEGKWRNSNYSGWVPSSAIKIDPQILQAAEASQQKRDAVKQAIKEKRVIEGMTFDDVRAALGKPDAASFRQEAGQRIDTWRYITYDRVARPTTSIDSFGRPFTRTIYVREQVGQMSVDFRSGVVTGIEQHEGKSPSIPLNR